MNINYLAVIAAIALTALVAFSLFMVGVMGYYGSYVIDRPFNPFGAEAQLGAFLGFLYAMPGLLLLTAIAWVNRKVLPRFLVLAPIAVSLGACAYFGYLRVLVAAAAPR